jgi:hypothetical protein
MPSEQDIRDAQASAFADDVPLLLPEMLSWTLDDVEKYFESDGEFRPGAAAPAVTAAATVAAPTGPRTFMVVHEPRIAIRKEPRGDGAIAGSLNTGTKVTGTLVEDGEWLKLAEEKGYALIAHPKLGELLRLVESAGVTAPSPAPAPTAAPTPVEEPKKGDPLKKSFETKVGRKACGANIKTVDAAGASRDTLFDHLVVQELLHGTHHGRCAARAVGRQCYARALRAVACGRVGAQTFRRNFASRASRTRCTTRTTPTIPSVSLGARWAARSARSR